MTRIAVGLAPIMLALMMVTVALTAPKAERLSAQTPGSVTVSVSCDTVPETTRITNNLSQAITVQTITSLFQPRANEPFTVNTQVPAGSSVTFSSGTGAPSPALTQQFIYENDAPNEGTQVMTSAGSFTVPCSQGSLTRTAGAGTPVPGGTPSVTAPRTGEGGLLNDGDDSSVPYVEIAGILLAGSAVGGAVGIRKLVK
jgi:hypothetical protein